MNTILIAHNFSKKSFAAMSFYLAHFLANQGYTVIFMSHKPYFEQEEIINKATGKIIVKSWYSENRPTGFSDLYHFITIYKKYKPKVVIGHFVGSNISVFASKLMSFFKVKTIVYYHTLTSQNNLDSKKKKVIDNFLLNRKKIFYKLFVDIFICPSNYAKKDLVNFFSVKNNIKVVLNPIPDRFEKNKSPNNDSQIVISYLGRLDKSKNVITLINAFLEYKKHNKQSNVILRIAGGGAEALVIKSMTNNCKDLLYLGKIQYEKVDDYLSGSNYTIIPSKYDNLPTVGIESLMNGTPLLISETTGLTEYCENDYDCFVFEPTNKGILNVFSKVERLGISNEYELMRINARKSYLEKFLIDNYCQTLKKIIEQ